jgi:hypothetical protein
VRAPSRPFLSSSCVGSTGWQCAALRHSASRCAVRSPPMRRTLESRRTGRSELLLTPEEKRSKDCCASGCASPAPVGGPMGRSEGHAQRRWRPKQGGQGQEQWAAQLRGATNERTGGKGDNRQKQAASRTSTDTEAQTRSRATPVFCLPSNSSLKLRHFRSATEKSPFSWFSCAGKGVTGKDKRRMGWCDSDGHCVALPNASLFLPAALMRTGAIRELRNAAGRPHAQPHMAEHEPNEGDSGCGNSPL